MNRKTKAAAAAAIAAALVGFAAGSACANAKAEAQKQQEARRATEAASLRLCESSGGRWGHQANGAPRCDTNATVRTRADNGDCPEANRRTEAGLALCDEAR